MRRRSLLTLLPVAAARAQPAWPDRPVRFVVAFAPGGPADLIARLLAQGLSEQWPHPVVVENRGGAGGNIAAQAVARMRADGSAALVTTSAFAVNPALSRRAGYAAADFAAAAVVGATPNLFVVRPDHPARTLRALVAGAGTRGIDYGSAGIGTTPHLSAENFFARIAGVPAQHIPFTGAGPALTAALGGQLDMASVAMSAAVELVRGGQARALAVTSAMRSPALPGVPTVAEQGFSGVDDTTWVAVFFPAGTPDAVLARVNADTARLLGTPGFAAALAGAGFVAVGGDVAAAQTFVAAETDRWGGIVRALKLELE